MNNCKNCNEPLNGNYCPNCGQPAKLKKIDGRYIFREIASAFNAESGMLYTIKRMLTSPGKSVRAYITEDRSRNVKPISFVIITALIYTLVNHFFPVHIEDYIPQADEKVANMRDFIFSWMQENSGYSHLIIGLFMAFGVKVFFRKAGFNLFEIYVLLCYVFGMLSLFRSLVNIFQAIMPLNLMQVIIFINLIYITWAVGQFFNGKKASSYIKACLSYLFGAIIFSFFVMVGFSIYFITKQLI